MLQNTLCAHLWFRARRASSATDVCAFKAVKDDLAANPGLRLAALAARQRVTPRYVQLLFEEAGTTFTAYARDERLNHAHRMLCDARYSRWTISAIAYRAGFGDLSHFNHVFRRRYGATPSEVREEAEILASR